jgi:hypothetical protein
MAQLKTLTIQHRAGWVCGEHFRSRSVAEYYPRRAVRTDALGCSPGCSQEPYRQFLPAGIFEPLFTSYYVGRVGLEPTTGAL